VIYRVSWTRPAQRDMARLPVRVAEAILTFVDDRLATNPARLSRPLRGEFEDLRSARNGDYRVLVRIDEDSETIFIRRVDHRAHVCRPGR
jgi:mRNA-degrading endonuclease RelE of RelBE toxin-antitoxin system